MFKKPLLALFFIAAHCEMSGAVEAEAQIDLAVPVKQKTYCCKEVSSTDADLDCVNRCRLPSAGETRISANFLCCAKSFDCPDETCAQKCCNDSDCGKKDGCSHYGECVDNKCRECGQTCGDGEDGGDGDGCPTQCPFCLGGKCRLAPGRPYTIDLETNTALVAPLTNEASEWSRVETELSMPTDVDLRKELAHNWARDALGEHASIASFSRFSLQLMSLGAPNELVQGAHEAAMDEIRHTDICFSVANAYLGNKEGYMYGPGDFPPHDLTINGDLQEVVRGTFREGAVAETVTALKVGMSAAFSTDTRLKTLYGSISSDEIRHALLAWKTLKWALTLTSPGQDDSVSVREILEQELDKILIDLPKEVRKECHGYAHGVSEYGTINSEISSCVHEEVMRGVVLPMTYGLLYDEHTNYDLLIEKVQKTLQE